MSKAVESIVSGYVFLKNREALEDLLAHRQKLLDGLKRVSGIDPNLLVSQIREEIEIIQTGLERLEGEMMGAQRADGMKVLQLTVSAVSPNIDKGASTAEPAADTARNTDLLAQPPARKADVEAPAAQAVPDPQQASTQIRVLGLAVSVASTGAAVSPPSAPPGAAVGGLDPGSFALCAPSSNQPMRQIDEEGKETETPYSTIDEFKSLVSAWNNEPTKP